MSLSLITAGVVFMCFLAGNGCNSADCPTIVSRSRWGANPPSYEQRPLTLPIQRVFIHDIPRKPCNTFISCSAALREIQKDHQHRYVSGRKESRTYSDIILNFVIGGDGKVYQGRGWEKRGQHTGNYSDSLSIGFVGSYSSRLPSLAMQTAAQDLINCGLSTGKIAQTYRLHAHRDGADHECPGAAFYAEIRRWWANYGGVLPGGRR